MTQLQFLPPGSFLEFLLCPPPFMWPVNEPCGQVNLFLSKLLLVMVSYLNTRMQTRIPRLASNLQQLSPQPLRAGVMGVAAVPAKGPQQLRTFALCALFPQSPFLLHKMAISLVFHPSRTPVLFGFPSPGLELPELFTSTVLGLSF